MESILEVKNLVKIFAPRRRPAVIAVNDVSFRLKQGEILGLVGGSGCGKSTLAKLITRLIEPTHGSVFLDGQDVSKSEPAELRQFYSKVQMVFQNPTGSFDPKRTLGDGIGESLKNRGIEKKRIKERTEYLMVKCGLPSEYAGRFPHEVSIGECQRAAIARAIAIEPRFIICDEATSSLDVMAQNQVMTLLKSLQENTGMSILFICHNFALLHMLCNRILVMCEGKIIEEGTPDKVILHPEAEYTQMLIDASEALPRDLTAF